MNPLDLLPALLFFALPIWLLTRFLTVALKPPTPLRPEPTTRVVMLASVDEPVHAGVNAVPLHISRHVCRRVFVAGCGTLAQVALMARLSAEAQDRKSPPKTAPDVVTGRGGSAVSVRPGSFSFGRPPRPQQFYRTPRTNQKPWRRSRGLTSAARRRQQSGRKGKGYK